MTVSLNAAHHVRRRRRASAFLPVPPLPGHTLGNSPLHHLCHRPPPPLLVPRAPYCSTAAPPSRITVDLPAPLGVSLTERRSRVVVTAVRPDSPAHGTVRVGDVVTSAAGDPVGSLADVVRKIRSSSRIKLILERVPPPSDRVNGIEPSSPRHDVSADHKFDAALAAFTSASPDTLAEKRSLALNATVARLRDRRARTSVYTVLARLQTVGLQPDARVWNTALSSLLHGGRPARAIALFAEVDEPSVECYTTVAAAYAKLRRPDDAIALIPRMRAHGLQPNVRTYNALIAACARAGRLSKARELFTEMLSDNVRPDVVSWNIIINWHVEQKTGSRRLAGALEAFEDMKASGVAPNVVTYTTLMKAYARSGMLHRAEEVFAELKRVLPAGLDPEAYNTLLGAYADRLEWRRCIALLGEMKAGGDAPLTPEVASTYGRDRRVPSNSQSFSGRRPWLSESEMSDSNKDFRSRRKGWRACEPDAVSFSLVVKACTSAGRPDRARVVFDEMIIAGYVPPPRQAVVSLLGGYARLGRLTEALGILREMKEWGMRAEKRSLSAVMHACLEAGEPKLALDVFARLKEGKLERDVVTDTLVLRAHGALGDMDLALGVLREMKSEMKSAPSVVTYNELISVALSHRRVDVASLALDELLDTPGVRLNRGTVQALVRPFVDGLGKEEGGKGAEAGLQFLMDVFRRLREKGATANGQLYAGLLALCEACGEWSLGRDLVDERERGGFVVGRRDVQDVRALEEAFRARELSTR